MLAADDATLLQRYHMQPGQTVAAMEPFRDPGGRSSYDLLAAEASGLGRDARVIDLACGDGYLLSLLAALGNEGLAGVDRSPEELGAARARLGPGVDLCCCDAAALPFAADSADLVTCHMALMLMESASLVLAEVRRVLRPGGRFAAVINRPHANPVYEAYSQEMRRVTAEAGLGRLRLAPPDIYTPEGLRDRLREGGFDERQAEIRDFVVRFRRAPDALWPFFESTYDVFRLSPPSREVLAQRLHLAWSALVEEDGLVTMEMGLRMVLCSKPVSVPSP